MPSFTALLLAIRPRQWIKNLLVAAAPLAAGTLDEWSILWRTIAATFVFTAAAGSTYLFNDTRDAEIDRQHPTKQFRPVAAGEILPQTAYGLASIFAASSISVAFTIRWPFGLVIIGYLLVNALYSLGMKHIPWIELAAIALGFISRGIGGGMATVTPLSVWFLVIICSTSLFVVTGKRSAELERTAGNGGRRVLLRYSAYSLYLVLTASAVLALVAYVIWVFTQDLATSKLTFVSIFPFMAALIRYAIVIKAGEGEDPEDIVFGDRLFQVLGLAWVMTYGLAMYA